ncbi:MAG: DUF2058 family protein [Xanthomonadales bacterium]|nr:DUF2058 family protein [Xanthomonadales bacterium]
MSDSLKDQLLKLGFKKAPAEKPRPETAARTPSKPTNKAMRKPATASSSRKSARGSAEMDLAKAFAIRAQKEKDERIEAERLKQEEARRRREGKAKLTEFLQTARRNDDKAEIARHFDYGGKIRRIYVNAEQLKALNAGELAVVQLGGRYHLVSAADGEQAEQLLAGSLALRAGTVEPALPEGYDDPKFQVPDDLVW